MSSPMLDRCNYENSRLLWTWGEIAFAPIYSKDFNG